MKKALQVRYFASQGKQPDGGPVLEASHAPFHPKLHKSLKICIQKLKFPTVNSELPLWGIKSKT